MTVTVDDVFDWLAITETDLITAASTRSVR